ncbi:MAG: hypothetical protein ABTQ34_03400 [Bdellovibrionales bacterium]
MTTFQKTPMLSELMDMAKTNQLSASTLAYLAERQRNNLYHKIMSEFQKRKETEGLTKAQVAKRMNKTPDIVSRLLGAPGNWTLDTVSHLVAAIGCAELTFEFSSLLDRAPRNFREPEWMAGTASEVRATGDSPVFLSASGHSPHHLVSSAILGNQLRIRG